MSCARSGPVTAQGGYEGDLFEPLSRLEPKSFWFRARNRLVVSTVRQHFPEARSLLEVGCGTGFVLAGLRAAFPGMRLVGGELYPEGLQVARRRLPDDVELLRLNATEMPFEREFDLVCAFDVLEHIDEDERALEGIYQAVRPGGGVILLVPQHQILWSESDTFARHRRRYSRRELVDKVTAAGFEIVTTTSFVTTLLPAMVAARLLARLWPRAYDPVRELRPGIFNPLFEQLLNLEGWLIERGVSLPVGGSLLVVGSRARN